MRLIKFYMALVVVNLFSIAAQAMLLEEASSDFYSVQKHNTKKEPKLDTTEDSKHKIAENNLEKNNQKCEVVFNKISEVEKILMSYEANVPWSERHRYMKYLKDLNDLHISVKKDDNINVRQGLYNITNKYF